MSRTSEMSNQTDPDGESGHNERERNRILVEQQFQPKKRYTGRHKLPVEEPMLAVKDTYHLGPLSWCEYYKPGCQPQNCRNCGRMKAMSKTRL